MMPQCSRECQTRHWRDHKTVCGSALQPGEADALRKIAGTMNARASEPEPEEGAPMPGRAAAFAPPRSDYRSEDLQESCRRRNTKPCNTCQGSGMVELQPPPKVRLSGLRTPFEGALLRDTQTVWKGALEKTFHLASTFDRSMFLLLLYSQA